MHYRLRIISLNRRVITLLDLGNPKNKSITTSHSTHGSDAEKGKAPQDKTMQAPLTSFFKNPQYCGTQERHGWTEATCKEMDELAQKDHNDKVTKAEFARYSTNEQLRKQCTDGMSS